MGGQDLPVRAGSRTGFSQCFHLYSQGPSGSAGMAGAGPWCSCQACRVLWSFWKLWQLQLKTRSPLEAREITDACLNAQGNPALPFPLMWNRLSDLQWPGPTEPSYLLPAAGCTATTALSSLRHETGVSTPLGHIPLRDLSYFWAVVRNDQDGICRGRRKGPRHGTAQ